MRISTPRELEPLGTMGPLSSCAGISTHRSCQTLNDGPAGLFSQLVSNHDEITLLSLSRPPRAPQRWTSA